MDGKVLILNYSEFERQKIGCILKAIGSFSIIEIASINECHPQMNDLKDISLVIIDIAFPYEEDGFEILELIKRNAGKPVSIIILAKSEKLQYRDRAVKYGVNDYIIKPFNPERLEKSIRSIVKLKREFSYDTGSIDKITIAFDEYLDKQLSFADVIKQPLTIIVITLLGADKGNASADPEFDARRENAAITALEVINPMLCPYDLAVRNGSKDILIMLPITDAAYGKACNVKINENVDEALKKTEGKFKDYFCSVSVTYPEEGKTFQDLMKAAYNKIADKVLYGKIEPTMASTREYAKKRYNQFTKWF